MLPVPRGAPPRAGAAVERRRDTAVRPGFIAASGALLLAVAAASFLWQSPALADYVGPAARQTDARAQSLKPNGEASAQRRAPGLAGVAVGAGASSRAAGVNGDARAPDEPQAGMGIRIDGMDISIEPPPGAVRRGTAPGAKGAFDPEPVVPSDPLQGAGRPAAAGAKGGAAPAASQRDTGYEAEAIPAELKAAYQIYGTQLQQIGSAIGDAPQNPASFSGGSGAGERWQDGAGDSRTLIVRTFKLFQNLGQFWKSVDPVALVILGILIVPVVVVAPMAIFGRRSSRSSGHPGSAGRR
ncbi:MAG: hypothetical protein IT514_10725 [Burkholderiales bacterium]|nr:hypothetical protein [Burkholderiales bacterium]